MSMSGIALADGFDLEEFQSLSWAQVRIVNDGILPASWPRLFEPLWFRIV